MHTPRVRQQPWPTVSACVMVLLLVVGVARAAGDDAAFDPGDLGQAIIAIAIFLLLLLILGKFAWGPIIAQLHSREDRIAQTITQAETRQTEADRLLAKYHAKIEGAQAEVEKLLTTAREQAEEHRQDLIAQAHTEADRSVKYAKHEIALAKEEALQSMRETTARMAVDLAEHVIRRELSPDDQDRLLNDALDQIAQHAAEDV